MFHLFDDADLHRHIKSLEKPEPEPTERPACRAKPAGVHLGTIVSFYENDAFAFVKSDAPLDDLDRGSDLFVHRSKMERGLSRGDRVSFDVIKSSKKPGRIEAGNVRKVA